MILGRREIFDATLFTSELARAVRGVLLVGVGPHVGAASAEIRPRATAWLITDTLAVICDYVLDKEDTAQSQFFCYLPGEPGGTPPIAADPVLDLAPGVAGSRPALLRL